MSTSEQQQASAPSKPPFPQPPKHNTSRVPTRQSEYSVVYSEELCWVQGAHLAGCVRVWYCKLDARYVMLDTRYTMLDARYMMHDTRHGILDS